jgi:hypothetical protein
MIVLTPTFTATLPPIACFYIQKPLINSVSMCGAAMPSKWDSVPQKAESGYATAIEYI